MPVFKLSPDIDLIVEPIDDKVRLVLTSGPLELACRKERLKTLQKALALPQVHLFKGRLQLHKDGPLITVILKGNPVASISSADFLRHLNDI